MSKKNYKDTPETLLTAILAMQDKIIDQLPEFEASDLTYVCEFAGGGERILPNPVVQEYRALVKDYFNALKAYKEISGAGEVQGSSHIEELRARLKVVV